MQLQPPITRLGNGRFYARDVNVISDIKAVSRRLNWGAFSSDLSRDTWDKSTCCPETEAKHTTWRPKMSLKVFAFVLADDRTEFALTLETLALKKSANVYIFEAIMEALDARLQTENILSSSKKGKGNAIDTSVIRVSAKYRWLKEQGRKYRDRAKNGSRKAAKDELEWFHIIDPIFPKTHTELKVATKAADIDILASDKCSEDDECSEEDKSDGLRPAASTERREKKNPLFCLLFYTSHMRASLVHFCFSIILWLSVC